MATSTYGNIFVASELEESIRVLLKKWFPSYLREIERRVDWDKEPLLAPRSYTTRNSYDVLPGEEMPKVVVISPGLVEQPEHPEADGYYKATWSVGVGIAIGARDEELADRVVKMYGAAARNILINHQSLGRDDVCYVSYLDENYDDLPIDDQLMLYKSAAIYVGVEVENVVNRFMRPTTPDEQEETLTTIEEVIIDLPGKQIVRPIP